MTEEAKKPEQQEPISPPSYRPLKGKFPDFHKNEDWNKYKMKIDYFFKLNALTEDEDKHTHFLGLCGSELFDQTLTLCSPRVPDEFSYEDIVKLLDKRYASPQTVLMSRHLFFSANRLSTESASEYMDRLRKLAAPCNFTGITSDDILCSKFILGFGDSSIQEKLLSSKDIKVEEILNSAIAYEQARTEAVVVKNTLSVHSSAIPQQVNSQGSNSPVSSSTVSKLSRPKFQPNNSNSSSSRSRFSPNKPKTPCRICGAMHFHNACQFKNASCYRCGQKGHIQPVCPNKADQKSKPRPKKSVKQIDSHSRSNVDEEVCVLDDQAPKRFYVTVNLASTPVRMQIDSGATVSVINSKTFNSLNSTVKKTLRSADCISSYTGEKIPVRGSCTIPVSHRSFKGIRYLEAVVTYRNSPNILGTSWSQVFPDYFPRIDSLDNPRVSELLETYKGLFAETSPTHRSNIVVDIRLQPNAVPKFCKARNVPLAIQEKLKRRLSEHVKEGYLRPLSTSDWATPVVPVLKPDGEIRICGDYPMTINPVMIPESYPLPLIQDLFAKLSGGQKFSKLDLRNAYLQFGLTPEAQQLTTINTISGLYAYTGMPFGITNAASIFQREMENLLSGLDMVTVFQDDILVTGSNDLEHFENLKEVFNRLSEANLKLHPDKCSFFQDSVKYLGHVIDAEGLHPILERIEAISRMPVPTNVHELKSFLGMVNYYSHFLPELSTVLEPLYRLLKKSVRFVWSKPQDEAFANVKALMQKSNFLCHYRADLPIRLTTDGSPVGVGAVLSHIVGDEEKPIAFASRTLTPAEKNYSQLDREALAIIFAVRKFSQYLYGRQFHIVTDHLPLVSIFSNKKPTTIQLPPRMLRWKLLMSSHSYTISHRAGKLNVCADALSRLPVVDDSASSWETHEPAMVYMLCNLPEFSETPVNPIDRKKLVLSTKQDSTLSIVMNALRTNAWPTEKSDELLHFYQCRENLSILYDCIMYGGRVVIPTKHRKEVIEMLHNNHPGISKMKSLARLFVWWPKLDAEIESYVNKCSVCETTASAPPKAPIKPLVWPDSPFVRVHADIAGPIDGLFFLVVVDSYSKWMDVKQLPSISSSNIIIALRQVFATYGLCNYLITDNGTQFTSNVFRAFCKNNGIDHRTVSSYHPRANGQAESSVKIFKKSYIRLRSTCSLKNLLPRFLLQYRTTPHTTTGLTPSNLMFGREIITPMTNILPSARKKVEQSQRRQDTSLTSSKSPAYKFSVGTPVLWHQGRGTGWIEGQVEDVVAPFTYKVRLSTGRCVKSHADNLQHARHRSSIPATPVAATASVREEITSDFGDDPDEDTPVTSPRLADATRDPSPNIQTPVQRRVSPAKRSTRGSRSRSTPRNQPGDQHESTPRDQQVDQQESSPKRHDLRPRRLFSYKE